MSRKALIVYGGMAGHCPKECAELFGPWLESQGFEVETSDTLDVYGDAEKLKAQSLIVPMWTCGDLTKEQATALTAAVNKGAGLAGFHAGLGDAFRKVTKFQFMVGGQFVGHLGGKIPSYEVNIVDHKHEITLGLDDFSLTNTEQYYMQVDVSNHVLATTKCENGVTLPAVWTRPYGQGRVFYASYGHTHKDFDVPEAREIVQRGMLWASR